MHSNGLIEKSCCMAGDSYWLCLQVLAWVVTVNVQEHSLVYIHSQNCKSDPQEYITNYPLALHDVG